MLFRQVFLLILFFPILLLSQATRWEDHFNYELVQEINQVGNKLYCTSSNALFTYDLEFNEVQKVSKTNLLNAVEPTSVTYNEMFDYLIVGYESGELDILGEERYNFVEIPLDEYAGDKSINHLSTQENLMLISADYGVSIFDLERREFSETTFFRQSGNYFTVNESEIFDNYVFSASENGVYSHPINDVIPNFNNWTLAQGIPSGNFQHIQKFNNVLLASSGSTIYKYENGSWSYFVNANGSVKDLNVNDRFLIVSSSNNITVFNESLNQVQSQAVSVATMSGIVVNEEIFAGTLKDGLVRLSSNESIYPDGPVSNNAYGVTAKEGNIWLSPGGTRDFNQPVGNNEGFSHYNAEEWIHISSEELNNAKDVIHISVNPNNINQVYASSWQEDTGLFEVENDQVVAEFGYTDMGQSDAYNLMRYGGSNFDKEGNLYLTQSFVSPGAITVLLKRTPQGNWMVKELPNLTSNSAGTRAPVIGDDGWVWVVGTREDGLMVTDMNDSYIITSARDKGELPSDNVYSVCIDENGTAWIGTETGLRVKNNPIRELEAGNFETDPVVIVQDGIPEALLTDTAVMDIKIDSSNRKWIATQGVGVFYVTEYGRETVFNFKEEDSPLPSDVVYAIAVDESTGIVYFATEKGLVSYKGDAVNTGDSFGEVVAYPNPVRPNYNGIITIKGVAENAEVKITDVVGNLLYETTSAGGIAQWDQTNLKGEKVASGVYFVLMINADGTETAYTKIAIIR